MKPIVYLADTCNGLHEYLEIFTRARAGRVTERSGLHVARSAAEARRLITAHEPDLVVASCEGDESEALELFRHAHEANPRTVTLLASRRSQATDLIQEIASGVVTAFLRLPCEYDELSRALERITIARGGARPIETDEPVAAPSKALSHSVSRR